MIDDKQLYTIYQGCHRSGIRFRPVFKRVNWLFIDFRFGKNAIYRFNDKDDTAINKLFGMSFGHHHKRSIRIGWNCNPDGKRIDLYAYVYKIIDELQNDGSIIKNPVRGSKYLCTIDVCQDYTVTMMFNYKNNTVGIQIRKCIDRNEPINYNVIGDSELHMPLPTGKIFPIKYLLYPYFGGKKTAPHNINILLSHKLI